MDERNEQFICSHCGQVIENEDDVFLVHDEVVCRECVDSCCTTCDRCGALIFDDDVYGDDDHCLCEHCYENHYTRCDNCDCVMSTALLALFPLFNQMIQPVMIPFFFGVWELISGLLKAIDAKGLYNDKIKGRQIFALIAAIELLSGIASMIKPVDDLLGINLVIAVIMFVQSVGFLLKAVYCKHIFK